MENLPKKLYLPAMKKSWRVSYILSRRKLTLVEYRKQTLIIYGKNYTKRAVTQLIRRWIKLQAEVYLRQQFIKLSRKTKIEYKKLMITSQKGQWGSCSSDKVVMLNYKIIFLPTTLVKHLMLHELCHIRHLNHSAKFWRAVAKYDRDWKTNKKILYHAVSYLPEWIIF